MNKTELIAAAAEGAGLTKKDTERVINAAIDAVTAALVKGDKVQISGLRPELNTQELEYLIQVSMVEIIGLEPMTPCLQSRCSPS